VACTPCTALLATRGCTYPPPARRTARDHSKWREVVIFTRLVQHPCWCMQTLSSRPPVCRPSCHHDGANRQPAIYLLFSSIYYIIHIIQLMPTMQSNCRDIVRSWLPEAAADLQLACTWVFWNARPGSPQRGYNKLVSYRHLLPQRFARAPHGVGQGVRTSTF
jgi:hypothetical protein